jgi:chemotaxis protein CheX
MIFNQLIIEPLGLTTHDLVQRLGKDVQEVFSTMAGITNLLPVPTEISTVTNFEHSITAMVGLAGSYNGIVSLHTSIDLAMFFTSGMLGMEVAEFGDDVRDALGELSNMIAGSFKHHLSGNGATIKISTPSVVAGEKYMYSSGNQSDTLMLRFNAGADTFLVSATLKREESG